MIVTAVLRGRQVRVQRLGEATFAIRGQSQCFGPRLLASVGGTSCT
jgi:hypothetical protein